MSPKMNRSTRILGRPQWYTRQKGGRHHEFTVWIGGTVIERAVKPTKVEAMNAARQIAKEYYEQTQINTSRAAE